MPLGSRTTTTTKTKDLADALRTLGLLRTAEDLADFISRATRNRWSVAQILEQLARAEAEDRSRRGVQRRRARSHLGRFKPMADFDWNWPKAIDREAVDRVLSLSFLERPENVVLVASPGLGKTMIAKNAAHAAVLAGHTALFVTASDLLLDLGKQEGGRALDRRLAHYAQPAVLVVDEVGYLSYDNHAADLIFQILTRRHERRSTIVTTNLAFAEWHTVFPNAACATALIDRLTHRAEILAIEGESYRKREAEQTQKERRHGK
ncbi:MAG: ATP-binding protein [Deltaproteobacteria bacterium]|nr:ATP-binding protein [Deltaproteobacteria bacterium]